jgi:chemotaxis protein methyltransferase CheR
MRKEYDFIFCRNVLIYFDAQTQIGLWPKFTSRLRNGGRLFLGHSERITDPAVYNLKMIGPTTYQKEA